EAVLFFALALNIQRRRRAEKELSREKALADAVIEGLPGIFLLQDKAGRNVRWNANAAKISRTPLGQVEPLGNVDEDDKEAVRQARQRVFQRGLAHVEGNILTEGGSSVPFYFTGVKVELEGEPHLAAIGIDLTERKKAEEALRQSESEIRSLVDNAPYGIATINVRQDRFLHANPAMVKLLGYKSEAEVQALTVSRDLYFEGDSAGFRAQPTRADFFNAVEFTWKRKDAKAVNVRASGRRITQGMDRGDLIELIAEDVTARRTLEEQLRHSQKMEALGQLSGSVAHDFNNLLSVVIGYSELLCAKPELDSLMRSYIESIKKAGERAASLTSQLLAFSRRQVMQPSVINLNILVRETENMLRRLMREDIQQEFILESALWKTRADPGQIIQVILNLAINGRDAMPKGGKLTVRTANVTFDDMVSIHGIDVSPGKYVLLSVTDTGTGMDAQTLERVFQPFFTTKDAGKGTGLGLATVYGIVKQSGGYVFVDSEMGKGSAFTIYLPRCEQRAAAPATQGRMSASRSKARNGSDTLLVVEDETAFRDLLRDGLQAHGFEVLIAANGVEALRLAEQFDGDIRLLVTDVIMPLMSGPELATSLKKLRPKTDVIYISGYTDDKLREEYESGELMLLHKPFYIDELLIKIQEVIARR
ncbi:MAG TPA: ATP-binding protein, partial [Candidatus Binatia bacterium]|nr:ATP-binding protein [Candidatus Binatia bacterium]